MKGREAREVYELIICSSRGYEKALEMAQRVAAGVAWGSSEKTAWAADALQPLLPALERPPLFNPRNDRKNMFIAGSMDNSSRKDQLYEWMTVAVTTVSYVPWPGTLTSPHLVNVIFGMSPRLWWHARGS